MSEFDDARDALAKVEDLLHKIEADKAKKPMPTEDMVLMWNDVVWHLCGMFRPEKQVATVSYEQFCDDIPRRFNYGYRPLLVALDLMESLVRNQLLHEHEVQERMFEITTAWIDSGLGREFYDEFFAHPQPFSVLRVEADPSEDLFPSMIQVNPDVEMNWGNILGEVANAIVGMMDHTGRLPQSREHARELLLLEFAKTLADGNEEDAQNAE